MADKTTLVVTAMPNPSEQESMQAYLKGVLPLLLGAGGQLVKRVKISGALTGKPPHGVVLVMDFPDGEQLERMFASEAYAALVPSRDKGFASMDICFAADL
jgi:uncharacterized protein (DUF1330 family)